MDPERVWRTATRISAWVVAALFVILLVTGVVLTFRYRPTVSYGDGRLLEHHPIFTARRMHRLSSTLFLPAMVSLAVSSIGLFLVRRERTPIVWPLVAAGLSVVAAITGYLLPWDQLGLRALTVGTNMEGYRPILRGHDVKFVLIGTNEISPATLSRWFWLHAVVVPVVLVLAVTLLVRRARKRSARA